MSQLQLSVAMGDYDRTRALFDGRVQIDGPTSFHAGLVVIDGVIYTTTGRETVALDERTANRHGLIGQETQGVGGFFMALRAIEVMKGVAADIEAVCPAAKVFNYTNPVNIVAQAWTTNTEIPLVSLCEGPIIFTEEIAEALHLPLGTVKARIHRARALLKARLFQRLCHPALVVPRGDGHFFVKVRPPFPSGTLWYRLMLPR